METPRFGKMSPRIVIIRGGFPMQAPEFASSVTFSRWERADSFHEARTLNKICWPRFYNHWWVRSLYRDCRINWNAMLSSLLEGKNFQDGGLIFTRPTIRCFTPGCCLAQLSLNLIFYFYFVFDEQARQTETNGLSIEVIRNLVSSSKQIQFVV